VKRREREEGGGNIVANLISVKKTELCVGGVVAILDNRGKAKV